MSIVIIAASAVKIMLLIRILNVVMSTVEVVMSPEQSNLSLPTANLTRSFSFLWGL
jgi:hypothetical protein